METFTKAYANLLPEGLYDHCTYFIYLKVFQNKQKPNFKYFKMWANDPKFKNIVSTK